MFKPSTTWSDNRISNTIYCGYIYIILISLDLFSWNIPSNITNPFIIGTSVIIWINHRICFEPTHILTIGPPSPVTIPNIVYCFESLFCKTESDGPLCCFWDIGRSLIDSLHDYEYSHWEYKYYNKHFYQSKPTKRFFLAEFSTYVLHITNFKVNTECTLAILFPFSRERKANLSDF